MNLKCKILKTVFLLFFALSALGQKGTDSHTIGASGGTITLGNNYGASTVSFEEIIAGSPATVSVIIQGCKVGGTCDTLDTWTTVANSIRKPTITTVYDTFTITATWTGGTNPSVTVNTTLTTAINHTYAGNAVTASSLASTPNQCGANNFATGVAANGDANCSPAMKISDTGPFGSNETFSPSACETSFATTTLSTGASTTDTGLNCLPATSVIDAVVYRITTTITTSANFQIGDATTAGRFCGTQSTLTAGTTGVCFVQADQTGAAGPRQASAAKVRVTLNANPGAGAIRLIVYYHTWIAPTS